MCNRSCSPSWPALKVAQDLGSKGRVASFWLWITKDLGSVLVCGGFEASKRGLNPAGTCSVGFEVQGLLVVLDRMRVLAFSPSHRLRVKGLGVCRGMGRGRLIL